jgi:hypothetical protein
VSLSHSEGRRPNDAALAGADKQRSLVKKQQTLRQAPARIDD